MPRLRPRYALALALAWAAAPAAAQGPAAASPPAAPTPALAAPAGPAGWSVAASVYGWLPALSSRIGTPLGTIDADLSASDAISNLDFAFMGAVEARRGPWGLVGDFVYSDISLSEPTPLGLRYSEARLDTQMSLLSAYALYRVHEDDRLAVDIGAGLRVISLDLGLDLAANRAPEDRSFDDSSTWADPLIAARAIVPLTENWFATAYGDYGGTGGGDRSWQLFSSLGYRFDDHWSARLGYRYLEIQKEIGELDTTMDLYGPLIGATYQF